MKKFIKGCLMLALSFHMTPTFASKSDCSPQALSQGGLLLAHAPEGAEILYQQKPVAVTDEGLFVIGFGRDAGSEQSYQIKHADGKVTQCDLTVKPQDYDIQRINGIAKKYVSPAERVLQRIREDNRSVRQAREVMTDDALFLQGMIMPAKGPITGVYGSQRVFNDKPRRPHFGLDIAGPVGTPIMAPADGYITLAEPDMYFSGGTLVIDHGFGLSSSMLHLSKLLVKAGDEVKKGQVIAEMGATGRVTGPHLDWRINWFQVRLDPQQVMKALASPLPAAAKR
ncbi:M23 family metallopeptidase [Spongorhabdus nitratireducens]